MPEDPAAKTEAAPPDDRAGNSALGRIYARALIELADQQGSLDAVAEQVRLVGEMVRDSPGFRELLESPAISPRERARSLERVFQGRVAEVLYKFLQVLNTKDRLESLGEVLGAFDRLLAQRRGIVEVGAFVAAPLPEAQSRQVAQSIGEALGGKRVVLHQSVDPSLIGGLKIRVGDQLVDGSVAAQLRLIRRRLTRAGREREMNALEEGEAEGPRGQGAEGPRG